MPFVIKTDPVICNIGDQVINSEKVRAGDERLRRGDEVFLWFSEQKGKQNREGLAWQGHISETRDINIENNVVVVHVSNAVSAETYLGKKPIKNFRNNDDDGPLTELARGLYRHAHNKVLEINHETADFIRQYFNR